MNTHGYQMPLNVDRDSKGTIAMLLQEDLARARIRESQRMAAEQRLARRLSSARRWQRLAKWVDRHAVMAAHAVKAS